MNDLAPEIVVYTGDIASHGGHETATAPHVFAQLPRGSRATLGVLGNHDYGPRWARPDIADRIVAMATEAGLRILRNEATDVDGLQFVGLDDIWADRFRLAPALAQLDLDRPSIALSHNPDTADDPGWKRFKGWILCGHTHGGQCKPPFLPPPILPVHNRRYTSGEFELSADRRMYINRGLGHTLRVRFNVRPEITVFRLAES